jgi:hypothetical protein
LAKSPGCNTDSPKVMLAVQCPPGVGPRQTVRINAPNGQAGPPGPDPGRCVCRSELSGPVRSSAGPATEFPTNAVLTTATNGGTTRFPIGGN